jgi:hypothetical protein
MGRGATEFNSLEGWLGHKGRSGGGGKYLSKWKEKGTCDVWLHTKRLPLAIWRHQFPTYVVVDDKESKEKVKHVFSKKYVCHEDESVLEHPWRDKVTEEREKPPQRCALCKFADYLWMQIVAWVDTHVWDDAKKAWKEKKAGKGKGIDPCALLFEFESEAKASENVSMYAGGFCNYFGKKELPTDVAKAMKVNKILGNEVWKQNCNVKCESVMCVVNNDDVAAGVQIAVEAQALGDAVKKEIQRVWKSNEINIQKQPYVIEWGYDEKESFSKKYAATSKLKVKPSERVLKLIRGEAPDLTELKKPFNQQQMRLTFEKHCLLSDVPWDEIFPSKEQEKKWAEEDAAANERDEDEDESEESDESSDDEGGDDAESDDDAEDSDDEDEKPKAKTSKPAKKKDDDEESEDSDEEMVACDECGKAMKLSATKCPHCGHKYSEDEEEPEEEAEEEKPKLKSRAEMAKEKAAAASKKSAPPKKASKKKEESEDDEDGDQEDGIPFD